MTDRKTETTDWRPIETVPTDGRRFLFWNGEYVCVAQFVMGKFFAAQGYPANGIPDPTHWMPLPEPPEGARIHD